MPDFEEVKEMEQILLVDVGFVCGEKKPGRVGFGEEMTKGDVDSATGAVCRGWWAAAVRSENTKSGLREDTAGICEEVGEIFRLWQDGSIHEGNNI
jgi:hypothetical protein